MHSKNIVVGGTYEVRFTRGVRAKAKILREVTDPEEMLPVRGPADSVKPESQYECALTQRVGVHPRGHTFKLKARSVLKLASLPDDMNGGKEEPAKREVKKVEKTVSPTMVLGLKLTLPVGDLPSLIDLLREYDPEITSATSEE